MRHKLKLTNGQTVTLDEDNGRLAIGQLDARGEDWCICTISKEGVLVDPHAGYATEDLVAGLQDGRSPLVKHEVWMKFGTEINQRPDHYVFETADELNAFLQGIEEAADCSGFHEQFDTLEEVEQHMKEMS